MIAIVTDSTAYLTRDEAKILGIHMVPLNYSSSGMNYVEGFSDELGNFGQLIVRPDCQTSQAAPGVFTGAFSELTRRGFQVLCVVLSSRLSGTFSSAYMAAREVDEKNIAVVDSLTTGGSLKLLLRKARALANSGLSLAKLAEAVENARDTVGVAFSVEDMRPLRKSGRIGLVRQSVSTILNIRPILFCKDGFVTADGFARGRAEQVKALVALVPKEAARAIVHHLGSRSEAEAIKAALQKERPYMSVELCPLGPVLGIHLGLGTVGIAWCI